METFVVQLALSIVLFILANWIGKHSYSIGYVEISIFVKMDEAPALNFLIRVLTPVVFIILVSTVFYYLKLDKYVVDIYMVSIYYILVRLLFNLATNRGLLLNWYRLILYWGAIVALSYFSYDKLIRFKANILPDFTTFANELWIIILVFIYQVINNIRLSHDGSEKRKLAYLRSRYNKFKQRYGKFITDIAKNDVLESVAYAVLIFEDFNRPKLIRVIENLKFKISKRPHTLGVMQVMTTEYLTDERSVILGTTKIVNAYNKTLQSLDEYESDLSEWWVINRIISEYNTGSSYSYEVTEIAQKIKELFYSDTQDSLEIHIADHNVGLPQAGPKVE